VLCNVQGYQTTYDSITIDNETADGDKADGDSDGGGDFGMGIPETARQYSWGQNHDELTHYHLVRHRCTCTNENLALHLAHALTIPLRGACFCVRILQSAEEQNENSEEFLNNLFKQVSCDKCICKWISVVVCFF
jgi:hypothetical protein